ncbi:unnamed protein product [Symbiodinium sp. KB8]|nr:unnamed protein product [Symbiodinium sp. KB8]
MYVQYAGGGQLPYYQPATPQYQQPYGAMSGGFAQPMQLATPQHYAAQPYTPAPAPAAYYQPAQSPYTAQVQQVPSVQQPQTQYHAAAVPDNAYAHAQVVQPMGHPAYLPGHAYVRKPETVQQHPSSVRMAPGAPLGPNRAGTNLTQAQPAEMDDEDDPNRLPTFVKVRETMAVAYAYARVFYTGAWTGDRPSDGLQYFGHPAHVVQRFPKSKVQLRFEDGKLRCTTNWSLQEPRLPGGFRRKQRVHYAGRGTSADGGLALFGQQVMVVGRVDSACSRDVLVQLEDGRRIKTCHQRLRVAEPQHSSGFVLHQKVYYTGSHAASRFVNRTSYYGQAAEISSFLPDCTSVRLTFQDDFSIRTSSFALSKPKLFGSMFSVGDELYYIGSVKSLFGKRATIKGVLADVVGSVLIEFRDGNTHTTSVKKLQKQKPSQSADRLDFRPQARTPAPKVRDLTALLSSLSLSSSVAIQDGDRLRLEEIFYTQDSIKRSFQDGRTLKQMRSELMSDQKTLMQIPRITVVRHEGRWFSVDNRRLWVFNQVFPGSKSIPVCHGIQDHRFWNKLTTTDGGRTVRVRCGACQRSMTRGSPGDRSPRSERRGSAALRGGCRWRASMARDLRARQMFHTGVSAAPPHCQQPMAYLRSAHASPRKPRFDLDFFNVASNYGLICCVCEVLKLADLWYACKPLL